LRRNYKNWTIHSSVCDR